MQYMHCRFVDIAKSSQYIGGNFSIFYICLMNLEILMQRVASMYVGNKNLFFSQGKHEIKKSIPIKFIQLLQSLCEIKKN